MAGRLDGKVAIITGTAGGQGRAAALRFAAEGARIVGCDLNAEEDERTVALVSEIGEMLSLSPVDISREQDVTRLIEGAVEHFGGFDILYNNASAARFSPIHEMSLEDWDFTLANELTGVFLAVRSAIPVFQARGGGVILNVASTAALVGGGAPGNRPGGVAHVTTKAGVLAMTRALACELAPIGVRVNAITPGAISTPGLAPLLGDLSGPFARAVLDAQLIGRIGQPDDTAAAAAFLCSDEASFITGANVVVDGGRVASGGVGMFTEEGELRMKFN